MLAFGKTPGRTRRRTVPGKNSWRSDRRYPIGTPGVATVHSGGSPSQYIRLKVSSERSCGNISRESGRVPADDGGE